MQFLEAQKSSNQAELVRALRSRFNDLSVQTWAERNWWQRNASSFWMGVAICGWIILFGLFLLGRINLSTPDATEGLIGKPTATEVTPTPSPTPSPTATEVTPSPSPTPSPTATEVTPSASPTPSPTVALVITNNLDLDSIPSGGIRVWTLNNDGSPGSDSYTATKDDIDNGNFQVKQLLSQNTDKGVVQVQIIWSGKPYVSAGWILTEFINPNIDIVNLTTTPVKPDDIP